jgi:hypothetical protein
MMERLYSEERKLRKSTGNHKSDDKTPEKHGETEK